MALHELITKLASKSLIEKKEEFFSSLDVVIDNHTDSNKRFFLHGSVGKASYPPPKFKIEYINVDEFDSSSIKNSRYYMENIYDKLLRGEV